MPHSAFVLLSDASHGLRQCLAYLTPMLRMVHGNALRYIAGGISVKVADCRDQPQKYLLPSL